MHAIMEITFWRLLYRMSISERDSEHRYYPSLLKWSFPECAPLIGEVTNVRDLLTPSYG